MTAWGERKMEQTKTEPKKNNKTKLITFAIIAIFAIVLGFAIYLFASLKQVTTDDAYIEGHIHSIASKIYGTVVKVNVDDNQAVKAGDLLVEVDPQDYQVKVNEDQAAVDAEKAKLIDAQAGIRLASANLEIQRVAFKQAWLDKKRAEALFKEEVITKERYEKLTTAYNMAAAQVKAASQQLEKAKSTRDLEESLVKQKEATLDTAQLNLSYTKIYAPSDGYVTKKSVEKGNQIQPGQPLMAVVGLGDIWVVANFKETQLKNVKPGQAVKIKIDTYPGQIFAGKVDSIMAGTGAMFSLFPPENALGNYVKVVQRVPVKIVFDKATDERHILRIGMSCVPTIIIKDE
jgi:membrane fusion protein (multidrug efflux system)